MSPERTDGPESVDIRPGTRILSALRHLNYKPWFALAEFVDNSLQSFLSNREAILSGGGNPRVIVSIDVQAAEPAQISVRDDAAGISAADYRRAFRTADIPFDATGLSEFGMGMKSAACWFAPSWHVTSSALGEPVERSIEFDIERILAEKTDELAVRTIPYPSGQHFTKVVLDRVYVPVTGRTLGKVKEHLTDIYRCFLREGSLILRVNGQALAYEEPAILVAPYYRDTSSAPITWRKEVELDLGGGQHAEGFAALRQDGKGARAGFALFRRNRLIQGSGDEGWKHPEVFGSPNSYRHQRLFGELHLKGFEVSHTKDGFRWTDEAAFAQLLADYLDSDPLPLLKQGEGHRQKAARPVIQRSAAAAVADAREDMLTNLEKAMPSAAELAAFPDQVDEALAEERKAPPALANSELSFSVWGSTWTVAVKVLGDEVEGEWLEVGDAEPVPGEGGRRIEIRISGTHPFMARFAHREPEVMQALVRVAASLGLAEALLRNTGTKDPGAIRRTVNELLREVFSTI